jgi:hypothetical protein
MHFAPSTTSLQLLGDGKDVKYEMIRPKVSLVPCMQLALSVCAQTPAASWCWMHFAPSTTSLQLLGHGNDVKYEMIRPNVSLVSCMQLAVSVCAQTPTQLRASWLLVVLDAWFRPRITCLHLLATNHACVLQDANTIVALHPNKSATATSSNTKAVPSMYQPKTSTPSLDRMWPLCNRRCGSASSMHEIVFMWYHLSYQ